MDLNIAVARAVDGGRLPNALLAELKKPEFCATESHCLDFKRDGYGDDPVALAEAVKDIAALHNTYGGFLIFGVEEVEKDLRYKVIGINATPFSMQLIKGKFESWLDENIDLSYTEIAVGDSKKVGVLTVPKRPLGKRPNQFKRRGPEIKAGKFAFDAGNVAIRRGDQSTLASKLADWQLVLSDRSLDGLATDLGRMVPDKRSGAALDHNLPSRAIICAQFIGRSGVLTELWAWLNDEFQYAKVVAGEGGKGKTSLAYEFATQVAYMAPLGIERIVWLTAKRRQFSGIENTWKSLPETHFQDFRTMLVAIGRNLAYTDGELEEASEAELLRLIRTEISIQPTLFVLDDIDSLSLDDQRRALEFAQQAGSEKVRFLLTTRSNASYSSNAAITLKGLEGDEYKELISVLGDRFGLNLPPSEVDLLEAATQGSPLLTESILRVVRRGSPIRKAIIEWKDHSGEDARNAVLGREIAQLSREAKRVLLCLAFLGQCSKAELMTSSGLLEFRLEDALEELQSLFIVNAPKIIASEPRFEISVTVALLVISKRSDLAGDHVALEKKIKDARKKVLAGTTQKHNKQVAIAISQALALLRNRDLTSAVATIDAALKSQKNHPDLLLCKGRMIFEAGDAGSKSESRKLFSQAYEQGARKHILFDLWYKSERDLAFGPGVIDVANSALKEFPGEEALWLGRRAEGYILNGLIRTKNREFDQAFDELSSAARELFEAGKKASDSEQDSLQEFLFGVHDQLLSLLPKTSLSSRSDVVSLIREMTDRGDMRPEVVKALAHALIQLAGDNTKKSNVGSQRDRFEHNRLYVIDLLRASGRGNEDIVRQVKELRFH